MTISLETNPPTIELEFTHEEQWAIHQALVDYIDTFIEGNGDLPPPTVEITILEKLESPDASFTCFELDRIRYECNYYRKKDDIPNIDRNPAKSVVNKINNLCQSEID